MRVGDLDDDDYLTELPLPSARGGSRQARPLDVQVVRALTEDDLPALNGPSQPLQPAARQTLTQLRHTHHQLARLLASGSSITEACLITGYSNAYVTTLKGDPAFEDLLSYYSSQRDQIFVDVVERMRQLGLHTLEEIQQRLADSPEDWSRRELMELAELMLLKPQQAGGRGGLGAVVNPAGAGISVNVNFVTATRNAPSHPVIDLEPEGEEK